MNVPFIIVITKCFGDTDEEIAEFKSFIDDENRKMGFDDICVIPVVAEEKLIQIGKTSMMAEPFEFEDLQNATLERLPEYVKKSFVAGHNVNVNKKGR